MSNKKKLKTEAEILAETLEIRTTEFNEQFEKVIAELKTQLKDMKSYNVMLQSVPNKIKKQIEDTVPKVAIELDLLNNKRLEKLEESHANIVESQHSWLKETDNKIQEILQDIFKIEKRRTGRFFLGIIISSIIATSAAIFAASYYVKGKFLQNVSVTHPDKIYLQDSEVKIIDWGKSKTYIQTPNKKK